LITRGGGAFHLENLWGGKLNLKGDQAEEVHSKGKAVIVGSADQDFLRCARNSSKLSM